MASLPIASHQFATPDGQIVIPVALLDVSSPDDPSRLLRQGRLANLVVGGNALKIAILTAALAYAASSSAATTEPTAAPVVAATPASTAEPTAAAGQIAVNTLVEIEITDTITSAANMIGDTFGLKLASPLIVNGVTLLPAGMPGRGEVTHAAKKGWGGRAGELIINARYLECGSLHIPLGHLHYQITGQSNVGGAFATAMVVPFGQFLVSGKDAVIPAGIKGTARVTADVVVPVDAMTLCVPQAG